MGRLEGPEVVNDSREFVFSKHNRAELTETPRAHKLAHIRTRQNPSSEKET